MKPKSSRSKLPAEQVVKDNHIHCAVLSREITINGFGGACTDLCSDRGYEAALAAWEDHKANWGDVV